MANVDDNKELRPICGMIVSDELDIGKKARIIFSVGKQAITTLNIYFIGTYSSADHLVEFSGISEPETDGAWPRSQVDGIWNKGLGRFVFVTSIDGHKVDQSDVFYLNPKSST